MVLLCGAVYPGWALDRDRLWLPGSYQQAMPALVAAALAAEDTRRCREVVAGKMVIDKSTGDSYRFVITCRDEHSRTYSLSYRSPVDQPAPELIAEQRSGVAAGIVPVDVATRGITPEQAGTLCLQ